jgi:hypothetical protein
MSQHTEDKTADSSEKGALIPELLEILDGYGKTALYVGASVCRAYLLDDLIHWGWRTTVVEIWPQNVEHIRLTRNIPVILGDIATALIGGPYDLGFWWHGPEHVSKEDLAKALANLEAACGLGGLVVLGAPEGYSPQGAYYDNPFESHLWSVSADDLRQLGYNVSIEPRPGNPPNITAWKRTR